jgi:hypothetical protein
MATRPAILSDHDVEGQLDILMSIWTSPDWIELWKMIEGRVYTFGSIGIPITTRDSDLWRICQERQLLLVTGNRNADDDQSLEVTIQRYNQKHSLPVVTLADTDRVVFERRYAERVAGQILEILYTIDELRGTQRLYVP